MIVVITLVINIYTYFLKLQFSFFKRNKNKQTADDSKKSESNKETDNKKKKDGEEDEVDGEVADGGTKNQNSSKTCVIL